ncbi:MAG: nitronate monooxygenase [Acidimicrobiia bacterium]
MRTPIVERLGAEFPIFAFSHCRDVVAAVTNAGGIGVLGALGDTPEELEIELRWIEDQVGDKPYGVDIVLPATTLEDRQEGSAAEITAKLEALIPAEHRAFAASVLREHGVEPGDDDHATFTTGLKSTERRLVDVVLAHKARVLVNALGAMPRDIVDRCHDAGVLCGGLVGSPQHAARQVANGVDFVVAQGTEAGGHTGDISTMVLIPQVVDLVGDVPVLAAGGIASGRQMAAALALGAQGVWTGSLWMTVTEASTEPVLKAKLIAASSSDTARSKAMTGKPNRLLKSAWTGAWDDPSTPTPLGWPLQLQVSQPAMRAWTRSGNQALATTSIGQGIGMINEVRASRRVVLDLVEEFIETCEKLGRFVNGD